MKKIVCFTSLVFFLFILLSCGKKSSGGTNPPADTPSDIQIDFPRTGVIYTNGFALAISGTVIDNNNLVTVKAEVKNKTSGATLYEQSASTGTVSFYRFQWSWTITGITVTTPATVRITATDKLNNQVSKDVDITLDN